MSTFYLVRNTNYYTSKNRTEHGKKEELADALAAARKLCDDTGHEHRVYEVRLVGAMRPRSNSEWVPAQELDPQP